jgi:hypothetical protein
MSANSDTSVKLDSKIIEALDFDEVLPCEHSMHKRLHEDEPAKYLIEVRCGHCNLSAKYLICPSGLSRMFMVQKLICPQCFKTGQTKDWIQFVETI